MMQILKTGTYQNKPDSDAKLRPHTSKAVGRESRQLKRLLSMTKEDEDRENMMLKHSIR